MSVNIISDETVVRLLSNHCFLLDITYILCRLTIKRRENGQKGFGVNRNDEEILINLYGVVEEGVDITEKQSRLWKVVLYRYRNQIKSYLKTPYFYKNYVIKENNNMAQIVGIDPSFTTGYARVIVKKTDDGYYMKPNGSGIIRTKSSFANESSKAEYWGVVEERISKKGDVIYKVPIQDRLREITEQLKKWRNQMSFLVIETPFFNGKNWDSLYKQGMIIGAIVETFSRIPIYYYNPTEVKKYVIGKTKVSKYDKEQGITTKDLVQQEVREYFNLHDHKFASNDESDAYAVILTHIKKHILNKKIK